MTDLHPGKTRVYAVAGVGWMTGGRWHDVRSDHPSLEGWLRAGLVQTTGPAGEDAPDRIPATCCGGK